MTLLVGLLFFSKISADSCFVAFHKSSFLILSDHLIPRILLKDLFINIWILSTSALVVHQFSKPYSSTSFTIEMNMLILVSLLYIFDDHTSVSILKADYALQRFNFTCCAPTLPTYIPILLQLVPTWALHYLHSHSLSGFWFSAAVTRST